MKLVTLKNVVIGRLELEEITIKISKEDYENEIIPNSQKAGISEEEYIRNRFIGERSMSPVIKNGITINLNDIINSKRLSINPSSEPKVLETLKELKRRYNSIDRFVFDDEMSLDNLRFKPLGTKCYGSIPHHSKSRLGPGDYHCTPGQEVIATQKERDKNDLVIVQEKLDGSNCSVAKVNGEILALTRAGYLATTSPYKLHHVFSEWVENNKNRFFELLTEKERVVGEWLYQAHGTRYNLPHEPFVAFDLIKEKQTRLTYNEFKERVNPFDIVIPHVYHIGKAFSLEQVLEAINISGHGAIDEVEGVIWRVERKGNVDFLIKYVRPSKVDGFYLPERNNGEEILNSYI